MIKFTKFVTLKTFTGMIIGYKEVVKETKKYIVVKTKNGILKFDQTTGIQIDAPNPKFANRVDIN